jgi:hypothetical protein
MAGRMLLAAGCWLLVAGCWLLSQILIWLNIANFALSRR